VSYSNYEKQHVHLRQQ